MPINDPSAPPTVRRPGLQVLFNGKPIPGAVEARVSSNNHYQADRASATFALNADAKFGAVWWASQEPPMVLDIQARLDLAQPWVSLVTIEVDQLRISPDGGTAEVEGRDLSSRIIEAPTAEIVQNHTSSEIVGIIAARHGLTADVTATTTLATRFWQVDHTNQTQDAHGPKMREWDMLVSLARDEGFDLYVTGTVLHFHPAVAATDDPYVVRYSPRGAENWPVSNAIGLRLERALTLAKDVQVVVKSFHSKTGKTISVAATKPGVRAGANAPVKEKPQPQIYTYVRPNLTHDQAVSFAEARLADISKHERIIAWSEPATSILTARNIVRLDGTGTDFDQVYYVDSIERTISFQGFDMRVRAKNSNVENQATAS